MFFLIVSGKNLGSPKKPRERYNATPCREDNFVRSFRELQKKHLVQGFFSWIAFSISKIPKIRKHPSFLQTETAAGVTPTPSKHAKIRGNDAAERLTIGNVNRFDDAAWCAPIGVPLTWTRENIKA